MGKRRYSIRFFPSRPAKSFFFFSNLDDSSGFCAVAGLCEDLDIDRIPLFLSGLIDGFEYLGNVDFSRGVCVFSSPAIEIPKINFLGQRLATLPLQIFSDIRFDRFDDARRLMVRDFEWKGFLHTRTCERWEELCRWLSMGFRKNQYLGFHQPFLSCGPHHPMADFLLLPP